MCMQHPETVTSQPTDQTPEHIITRCQTGTAVKPPRMGKSDRLLNMLTRDVLSLVRINQLCTRLCICLHIVVLMSDY